MNFFEVFLIGIGLSADAFAVSISNGMCYSKVHFYNAFLIAFVFGFFQFLMPFLGYLSGSLFYVYIKTIDHYLVLILLCFLGGKMLFEGLKCTLLKKCKQNSEEITPACTIKKLSFGELLLQGFATSLDALAVGISLSMVKDSSGIPVLLSVIIIGLTTFAICFPSVYIGKKMGDFLKDKANIVGGLILISIGVKVFIQHVFFEG